MYTLLVTKRYSIADARSNLPRIVDQAEAGEAVELTRRGKPVAVLVSVHEFERLRAGRVSFGDALRRFTATHSPQELGSEDDAFAAVRDREPGRKVAF